jgi:hypothetical protein
MVESTPAGWYDDPGNPGIARWWDGTNWTEARRPVPQSGPTEVVVQGANHGFAILLVFVITLVVVFLLAMWSGNV